MNDKERIATVFDLDDWKCVVCGKDLRNQTYAQRAHVLSQGKTARKKYGNNVIDSVAQQFAVCSLECNGKVAIGLAKPLLSLKIAALAKVGQRDKILALVRKNIEEKERK